MTTSTSVCVHLDHDTPITAEGLTEPSAVYLRIDAGPTYIAIFVPDLDVADRLAEAVAQARVLLDPVPDGLTERLHRAVTVELGSSVA